MRGTRLTENGARSMSEKRRQEGLAQLHDIRRRLADRDFSDVPDLPDEVEVVNLADRKREDTYDKDHPTMIQRCDINR